MGHTTAPYSIIALASLLFACAPSEYPSSPLGGSAISLDVEDGGAQELPAWITDPEEFPVGLQGTNNCTFAFGQVVPQWDFHPDAGCWERPGPDGWTRQHIYKIHVPAFSQCNGGPGDVYAIRVCREPGVASPCPFNPTTGPNGCAVCVRAPTCH